LVLIGGLVAGGAALAVAIASSQLSGCCGGSPTHGCKFVETADAAKDQTVSDAALNCPSAPCASGQICCIESDSPTNPVRCIAAGEMCSGLTGDCRGDQDCPFGDNLHCCGNVDSLSARCQSECSGNFDDDGTVRVCLNSAECPAGRPLCGGLMVGNRSFYGCITARD
jgi:hypothetical protein